MKPKLGAEFESVDLPIEFAADLSSEMGRYSFISKDGKVTPAFTFDSTDPSGL